LAAGRPVDRLSHAELVARQPQYAGLSSDEIAVWDPEAGICYPERNVRAHVAAARRLGATVFADTEVLSVEVSGTGAVIRTQALQPHAAQVIVPAGAWLGSLVPDLPLTPRRFPLCWFTPRDPSSTEFGLAGFPAFIWQRSNGEALWGHGSDEDYGVKIG